MSPQTGVEINDDGEVRCPSCGNWYAEAGFTVHISRSECEWPVPTRAIEKVLLGLRLCGQVVSKDEGLVSITVQGPKKTVAHYCEMLGFWCAECVCSADSPYVSLGTGVLHVRSCPWVRTVTSIDIPQLKLYPETVHTLLTFTGRVERDKLVIESKTANALGQLFAKEGFGTYSVHETQQSKYQTLRFNQACTQDILDFSGVESVPGRTRLWTECARIL